MIDELRERLNKRPYFLSYRLISERSGISISWLAKFAKEKQSNPKINTLEKLKKVLDEVDCV